MYRPVRGPRQAFVFLVISSFSFLAWGSNRSRSIPAEPNTICEIQGAGFVSPLLGKYVQTTGVVTADLENTSVEGFFMQDEACDGSPVTSDAVFVYLGGGGNHVAEGDRVRVTGWVREFQGLTELAVPPGQVVRTGRGLLPAPVPLVPPWDDSQAALYLERREGMLVSLPKSIVVGPTGSRGETYVVRAGFGITHVFAESQPGLGAVLALYGEGANVLSPGLSVGQQVEQVQGVLDTGSEGFRVFLTAMPAVTGPVPQPDIARDTPFLAAINLYNLFDTVNDPGTADSVPSAAAYQRHLQKLALTMHDLLKEPLLVAVQEAENQAVLQALVNRPELDTQYFFIHQDGPDQRGLDVALLFQPDYVEIITYMVHQGCVALVDGLGPDGNLDPVNPVNKKTCGTNGDQVLDGNRLFSRPPLAAMLALCTPDCAAPGAQRRIFWVIVVHLKSKTQDTAVQAYTEPRRMLQVEFLAGLVNDLEAAWPGMPILAAGDFNDVPGSQPLAKLYEIGMRSSAVSRPLETRYTYIHQGLAQVLDDIYLNQAFLQDWTLGWRVMLVHANADYASDLSSQPVIPIRASDHDPVALSLFAAKYAVFLPVAGRAMPARNSSEPAPYHFVSRFASLLAVHNGRPLFPFIKFPIQDCCP